MSVAAHALTNLATVLAELGLSSDNGGPVDIRLERYINAVSAAVTSYCNRIFQRQSGVAEPTAGYGTPYLLVARTPILSIGSITYDGDAVDSNAYEVHDADAGMIRRIDTSWLWTTLRHEGITQPPLPGYERKRYGVTYDGGYITLPQTDSGGVYAQADVGITRVDTTATVDHADHKLVTGDQVVIAGTGQQEYRGTFVITVVDADFYTYTVLGDPTTPALGNPVSTPVPTLPADLEDVVVEMVTSRNNRKGQDGRIKSEKLMSYAVSYGSDDIPVHIKSRLDAYKRPAIA